MHGLHLAALSVDPLLSWTPVVVVVRCEGGGAFPNIPNKSQSFSGPVSLDCNFHRCLFFYSNFLTSIPLRQDKKARGGWSGNNALLPGLWNKVLVVFCPGE